MSLLADIFGPDKGLAPAQQCARAVLIFAYGFVAVRLVGRRVFGKWAALDIIVSIMIGSNLSRALTGNTPLWGTMGATSVLLAAHWILAQAAARHPRLSHLIEGRPAELFRDGAPDRAALRRWSISEADLNEALRQRGLERPEHAKALLLEPSGAISALHKD